MINMNENKNIKLLQIKIKNQENLIRKLKNVIKLYAPYMKFPDE